MKFLLLRLNVRPHGLEGDKIKSRGLGKACIKIITKMFSNLQKEVDAQMQEEYRTSSRHAWKRITP